MARTVNKSAGAIRSESVHVANSFDCLDQDNEPSSVWKKRIKWFAMGYILLSCSCRLSGRGMASMVCIRLLSTFHSQRALFVWGDVTRYNAYKWHLFRNFIMRACVCMGCDKKKHRQRVPILLECLKADGRFNVMWPFGNSLVCWPKRVWCNSPLALDISEQ